MSTLTREREYIRKLRRKATAGDSVAIMNTAQAYRRISDPVRMFQWYLKAAKRHDGDALLEIGHGYQFGVGTRRNLRAAERSYRAAIGSGWITESGREEAMFFLATLLLSLGRGLPIEVRYLLIRANVEHDYPQAASLRKLLGSESWRNMCVCRRDPPSQIGATHCPVHDQALANNAVNAPVLASRRLRGKRRASRPARYRGRWADKHMLRKAVVLAVVILSAGAIAYASPLGTWAWHGKWQTASGQPGHTANADGIVVSFCEDGRLRIASGTLYRTNDAASLGSSDGLALYEGRWSLDNGVVRASYALVDAEIRSSNYDRLVNVTRSVAARLHGERLVFTFYRASDGQALDVLLAPAATSKPAIAERFAECVAIAK